MPTSTRPTDQQIRTRLRDHKAHVRKVWAITDDAVLFVTRKGEAMTSFYVAHGDDWEFSVPYEGFLAYPPYSGR